MGGGSDEKPYLNSPRAYLNSASTLQGEVQQGVELMQILIEKGYCAKPRDKLSEEAVMNLNCWIDDRLAEAGGNLEAGEIGQGARIIRVPCFKVS